MKNMPILAIVGAALFLIVAAVLLITVEPQRQSTPAFVTIITLIASTIPAFIAAAFAERASRDIRNGTVTDKAAEGAARALDEKGVTAAVENGVTTTNTALLALTQMLDNQNKLMGKED